MKNKFLTAILGTAMVMTAVTGCGQQDAETEMETLEIAAIETVAETEVQSEEMEFMELDLAELQETSVSSAEVSTGDLIESEDVTEAAAETVSKTNTRKPGEAESETELQEKETGKVQKETRKQENTKENSKLNETRNEQETEAAASEQAKQDPESTEVFDQVETETIVQRQETVPKTETEQVTETETEQITETETEQITEIETEQITETETEQITETETEQVAESETEQITETETEQITETETEQITETETEQVTETETEQDEQKIYMTVNDRVNVRREASTESDTLDLLIPGSLVEVKEETGEWSRICYTAEETEIDGYIKTEFLISAEAVYTPLEKVNVRKEASVDAEKLGQLTDDDRVVVLNVDLDDESVDAGLTENADEQNDTAELPEWFEICYSNDGKLVEGYVKAEFLKQVDLEELLKETEPAEQSESDSADANDKISDAETAAERKTETSDTETERETETEIPETMLSYGLKGQLELLQLLFPGRTNVGIIYSSKDKGAAVQLAEYEVLADTYGLDLHTAEIIDELDIDLTASVLVGSVDAIICLDDQVVNELTQTICAYAGEVEIPVIGISKEQTDMGCAASYDGTTVFWNEAEAGKFGLSSDMLHLVNEVVH